MIGFYVSSHGFGHITRCIAIIEELLSTTQLEFYIVSDQPQIDFARQYLDGYWHRVTFTVRKTDVGLINKEHSLEVDHQQLEHSLEIFLNQMTEAVKQEVELLETKRVQLIITDISILGILVAKELNVQVIGISNFTWYDQYRHLNIKPEITQTFKKAYESLDYYYEYDFALEHDYLNCPIEHVGLISRRINQEKVNLIKKNNKASAYISCGRSAALPIMNVDFKEGVVFHTLGIDVKSNGLTLLLGLNMLDTHNYLSACNLSLIKSGWSSVAEALIGHTPLIVIERQGVLEDTVIINKLKARNLCISIKEEALKYIDMKDLLEQVKSLQPSDYENNVENLCDHIMKHTKNAHNNSTNNYWSKKHG